MSCEVSAFWPRLCPWMHALYSGMREHNKFELFGGKWCRRHQTALRQKYVTTQAVKCAHYTSERCQNMRGFGAGRNVHPQTFQLEEPPWSKTRTIFQLATRDETYFMWRKEVVSGIIYTHTRGTPQRSGFAQKSENWNENSYSDLQ